MVAISVLQAEPDIWHGRPVEGPADARPARSGHPLVRSPSRALPDRATRWRRRRLAALVLGTTAVVAGATAGRVVAPLVASPGRSVGPAAGQPGATSVEGEVYVVQPGDTLWTVAAAVAPDRDPRPVVDRLREVNGGAALDVGDRLVIDLG